MSKQIAYTDATIKHYTEGWANERIDKKAYIKKCIIRTFIFLSITSIPSLVHFWDGMTVIRGSLHVLLTALVSFGWAFVSYNSMERYYRKFLRYQESKQLKNPKPSEYYN